jgi:hypothetical protein
MDPKALATIPDIIKAASTSPLGILALLIVVLGILALAYFRKRPSYQLLVFLCFFVGVAGFGVVLIWLQRDDAARALAQATHVRDLRLHLVFAGPDAANPMSASVQAFRQRPGQEEKSLTPAIQLIRGAGGMMLHFDELDMGDRVYVLVSDHGKEWRSDDMRVLEAQLAMNPFTPLQP